MCDSVRLLFFFFFLLTWPRTHDDRTGRVFPDHLITYLLLTYLRTSNCTMDKSECGN